MVNKLSKLNTWSKNYKGGKTGAYFSLMLYLNASSVDVAPVWGAYAHELILRKFFSGV